jgi:hypothetical protein
MLFYMFLILFIIKFLFVSVMDGLQKHINSQLMQKRVDI